MSESLFIELVEKCRESGIAPDQFIREKILELEERRRILLTPNKNWFRANFARFNEYAEAALQRNLDDEEKYGPLNLAETIRRRFSPGAREQFDSPMRRRLLDESNSRCVVCGMPLTADNLQVDHVVPLAEGGSNHSLNLQALCTDCNAGKSEYFEDTAIAAARPWWEPRKSLTASTVRLSAAKRYCAVRRDDSRCVFCGAGSRKRMLKVIPRVPPQRGGQLVYDNLITACGQCLDGRKE